MRTESINSNWGGDELYGYDGGDLKNQDAEEQTQVLAELEARGMW